MSYRIAEWDERYEVNDKGNAWTEGSVKRRGPLEYVRHSVHGKVWTASYRRFLALAGADAPAIYGVWAKVLELAGDNSREFRGTICDDRGIPMNAEEIATALGWPSKIVDKALQVLSSQDVGWIMRDNSPELPGVPRNSRNFPAAFLNTDTDTDTDTKQNTICAAASAEAAPPEPQTVLTFPCNGTPTEWHLTREWLDSLAPAYPGVDLEAEARKALAWVRSNRRKTARGMTRFLNGWFARANDRSRGGGNGIPPKTPEQEKADRYAAEMAQMRADAALQKAAWERGE